jgi:hypothetical protein
MYDPLSCFPTLHMFEAGLVGICFGISIGLWLVGLVGCYGSILEMYNTSCIKWHYLSLWSVVYYQRWLHPPKYQRCTGNSFLTDPAMSHSHLIFRSLTRLVNAPKRRFSQCPRANYIGIYRTLPSMKLQKPWLQALAEKNAGKVVLTESLSPPPTPTPKRMSDSYHSLVRRPLLESPPPFLN